MKLKHRIKQMVEGVDRALIYIENITRNPEVDQPGIFSHESIDFEATFVPLMPLSDLKRERSSVQGSYISAAQTQFPENDVYCANK